MYHVVVKFQKGESHTFACTRRYSKFHRLPEERFYKGSIPGDVVVTVTKKIPMLEDEVDKFKIHKELCKIYFAPDGGYRYIGKHFHLIVKFKQGSKLYISVKFTMDKRFYESLMLDE